MISLFFGRATSVFSEEFPSADARRKKLNPNSRILRRGKWYVFFFKNLQIFTIRLEEAGGRVGRHAVQINRGSGHAWGQVKVNFRLQLAGVLQEAIEPPKPELFM